MKTRKGFLLVGVLFAFLFLLIIVPVMVKWVQNDTKISVKDQKSSLAFSLAEAAIDRGYWKVKSSTSTFYLVSTGGTLPGYDFDGTYTDIAGGSYRVRVSSGPGEDQITILGEGRDSGSNETRAIRSVYNNTSVPGAILSGGSMTQDSGSVVHWGPVMAKGDITVSYTQTSPVSVRFPRKLSQGTVRDLDPTHDTTIPNQDGYGDWQSGYNVPELPVFDFEAMKSSAAATHTLACQDGSITTTTYTTSTDPINACVGKGCADSGSNCGCVENHCDGSGCVDSGSNCTCTGSGSAKVCSGKGCTDSGANCDCTLKTCTGTGCYDSGSNCGCGVSGYVSNTTTTTATYPAIQCCYYDASNQIQCDYPGTPCTDCTVTNLFDQTTGYNQVIRRDMDYTWYWPGNVTWKGYTGLRGTIIALGDLTITSTGDDRYCRSNRTTNSLPANPGCKVKVPPNAWQEYKAFDASSTNQYPGDLGKSSSTLTYTLGTSSTESGGSGGDLGVYGFVYVGGNFARYGAADIYGAIWVRGGVSGSGNTMVFYNSNLKVPTLNVVLMQDSWQEQAPSSTPWP